jgi:cytochrome c-type biogenesis protein CcmH
MVWLIALALAAGTFVGLWRSGRFNRTALELLGVACLLGLAGYAWQGSPSLPEAPAQTLAPALPALGGQK